MLRREPQPARYRIAASWLGNMHEIFRIRKLEQDNNNKITVLDFFLELIKKKPGDIKYNLYMTDFAVYLTCFLILICVNYLLFLSCVCRF